MPVLTHPLVEPDKGTGLVMVCTFGDVTDVVWWRELGLPVRSILAQTDGCSTCRGAPRLGDQRPGGGAHCLRRAGGRHDQPGARRMVEMLEESGDLVGEPQPVTRAVKFFEKGERPVEIVTSRQWFIRTIDHREELLERGRELEWHPPYMRARFEELGQRPERRLVHQPPALLRGAVPGLVPDRRDGQRRAREPDPRSRSGAAGRPLDRRARGL